MNRLVLQRELQRLSINGLVTPDAVVAAATPVDHPLHDQLDWDDARAAHAHRLDQARTLIRSVRLIVHESRISFSTVAYVKDATAEPTQQGYIAIQSLIDDEARSRMTVEAELARLSSILARVREIAATLGHEDMVNAYLSTLASSLVDSQSRVA